MNRFLLCALLSMGAMTAIGQTSSFDLERLMQNLAQVDTVQARFRERKELAILEKPLLVTGKLIYRAPDYVEKRTLEPYRETFRVEGNWLVLDDPREGKRHLSLRGYPAIQAFVESFRATLAGDLVSLKRHYRVRLQGDAGAWSLYLEPTDRQMAEYVASIIIRGRENRIVTIETREADGDRSIMTIVDDV